MRHRREVAPTARLVIVMTKLANRPLSYAELMDATGASRSTLERIMPGLVKGKQVVRLSLNGMSYFAAPPQPVVPTSEEVARVS